MKKKLVKLLEIKKWLLEESIKDNKLGCAELVKTQMHYAIDTYLQTGLIDLKEARELWQQYDVEYCF